MFIAKTEKIREIAEEKQDILDQLNILLDGNVKMYIDYANVKPWSEKLGWHIEIKRLRQFLECFDNIKQVNFYHGELEGNEHSEREINIIKSAYFNLRTKPVKIMKHSIDASSVTLDSKDLLSQFIRKALMRKYTGETVEYLNTKFKEMNTQGQYFIEDRKCNFDVEIGVDMLLDCERGETDTFVLWSGDSDFADSVNKLLDSGKKVILFATARRVSTELQQCRVKGLKIFDIQKINDFICRQSELKKAKGTT